MAGAGLGRGGRALAGQPRGGAWAAAAGAQVRGEVLEVDPSTWVACPRQAAGFSRLHAVEPLCLPRVRHLSPVNPMRSRTSLPRSAPSLLLPRVAFVMLDDFDQRDASGITDTVAAGVLEGQ